MDKTKTLLASRTFWACVFGLVAQVAGVFNLSTVLSIASDPGMVDKALFVIGSISSISAIFFRAKATAVIVSPAA